jgi:RNA polymerase sigma-70 factor (ECF subfamily)
MEDSDSVAVARVKSGDGDAYRVLVDRHSRSVFRLAYRMTGNEQDSEDVVQETFLRAYKQLHRWEARSSFGTWLFRIAANYSLDLMRRRKRHGRCHEHRTREELTNAVHGSATHLARDRLLGDEVQRTVASTLDQLEPAGAHGTVLRHFEGQTIEEISSRWAFPATQRSIVFFAWFKIAPRPEPEVNSVGTT